MSYFLANTITISKDFKTFNVKGGSNNVIPRGNEWIKEIPIDRLYSDISSGEIQFAGNKDIFILLNNLVKKFKISFGGNFGGQDDYFHLKVVTEKTLDELKTIIQDYEKELLNQPDNRYLQSQFIFNQILVNTYNDIKLKIDNFDRYFLKELKTELANYSSKKEYIIKFYDGKYLMKNKKNGCDVTLYRESSQKLTSIQADDIIKRFLKYEPIKEKYWLIKENLLY